MSKDDIVEKMSRVKSKIECMAHFKSEAGANADYGFYLVMSEMSDELELLGACVDRLGEATGEKLSELFKAN